jgi:hypothetical protein
MTLAQLSDSAFSAQAVQKATAPFRAAPSSFRSENGSDRLPPAQCQLLFNIGGNCKIIKSAGFLSEAEDKKVALLNKIM